MWLQPNVNCSDIVSVLVWLLNLYINLLNSFGLFMSLIINLRKKSVDTGKNLVLCIQRDLCFFKHGRVWISSRERKHKREKRRTEEKKLWRHSSLILKITSGCTYVWVISIMVFGLPFKNSACFVMPHCCLRRKGLYATSLVRRYSIQPSLFCAT